ncbi:MAG: diguanylate cyclase [Sedimenticola sp.]|nr:diguanylate cyclase [Sedimenticola sp.]
MKLENKKNLIYISMLILLIDLVFVLVNRHFTRQSFESEVERYGEQIRVSYDLVVDDVYANLLSLATFISSDGEVQQLVFEGKQAWNAEPRDDATIEEVRNSLLNRLADNWQRVKDHFAARQLHFHMGPGSNSFLRVHRPKRWGDNMDNVRHTIVAVNTWRQPVTGFETGRVYSGLRGAVPITYFDPTLQHDVHLGALEAGASFDRILTKLDQKYGVGAAVLLTAEHVRANMWPEAIQRKFGEESVPGCDCYYESFTRDNLDAIVRTGLAQGVRFTMPGTHLLQVGADHFAVTHFPLRDFHGTENPELPSVGAVLFWRNINANVADLENSNRFNILYGIAGYIVVECLLVLGVWLNGRRLNREVEARTRELVNSKSNLLEAQTLARMGSWELDLVSNRLHWSRQIFDIFELSRDQQPPSYQAFLNVIHPDDREMVDRAYNRSLEERKPYDIIHRLLMPDGRVKYVHEYCSSTFDPQGRPLKSVGTVQDITEQYQLQAKERLSQKLFEYSLDGIMVTGSDCRIVDVNDAFCQITGYDREEVVGQNPGILRSGRHEEAFFGEMWDSIRKTGSWKGEMWNRRKSGEIYPVRMNIIAIPDNSGETANYVGIFTDITRHKEHQDQLEYMANHDVLTGLPNRQLLLDRLEQAVKQSRRNGNELAVVFFDLDQFKPVNDRYGHEAGDAVLVAVAGRIRERVRDSDTCGRIGGDEFVILFGELAGRERIENLVDEIIGEIRKPVIHKGHELQVSVSAGIRFYRPDEACGVDTLLKQADKAMYRAKALGRNRYTVFE